MTESASFRDPSVGSTWVSKTPDKSAIENKQAERGGAPPSGKIGAHRVGKNIGNLEQASKASKAFDSMMRTVGGAGLNFAAGASHLLKLPLLNAALYRTSFATILGRSKKINSYEDIKRSGPGSISRDDFERFRNFTGQLVRPSETLNKWSLSLIKEKNEKLHEQIKDKPTDSFTPEEQMEVDLIHFQGIQEHLNLTAQVGNADRGPTENHEIREAHVAEVLAKSLAYLDNIDGKKIQIPIRNSENGTWEMKEYIVETKAIGDNLPIHVLKPTEPGGKTFIVVRGTELRASRSGAAESVFADVDPNGIGHSLVKKEMNQGGTLREVLNEAGHDNAILVGHSLGGAIVNSAAIRDIDLNRRKGEHHIHKVYGFSAPGVGKEEAKLAGKEANKFEVKHRIHNYQTSGDVVPTVGNAVGRNSDVGLRGFKGQIKEAKMNAIDAHFTMGLNKAANVTPTSKLDELVSIIPRTLSGASLGGPRWALFRAGEKSGATPTYYMKA